MGPEFTGRAGRKRERIKREGPAEIKENKGTEWRAELDNEK